jgi:FkbM family methyltransferase
VGTHKDGPVKLLPAEQIQTLYWVLQSGLIKNWGSAVDGGAHIGDWSALMADFFTTVHAFEPGGMFRARTRNIVFHPEALLHRECRVTLATKKNNNRGWYVLPDEGGAVKAAAIDALGLKDCGLIKLDLEGAEGLALHGAASTLEGCRPVVIIEVGHYNRKRLGLGDEETRAILTDKGYRLVHAYGPDEVYAA